MVIVSFATMELLAFFDDFTLQKGTTYLRDRCVITVSSKDARVTGSVRGSAGRIYTSTLQLCNNSREIDWTKCTCPIGGDCKHTAALLLAYLSQSPVESGANADGDGYTDADGDGDVEGYGDSDGDADPADDFNGLPAVSMLPGNSALTERHGQRAESRGSSLKTPEEMLRRFMPPAEVCKSFERLAAMRNAPEKTIDEFVGTKVVGPSYKPRSRYVYLLGNSSWRSDVQINLATVSVRADGSFGSCHTAYIDSLLERLPPQYATEEDIAIAKLWRQATGNSRTSHRFHEAAPELLTALMRRVLNTNRCFIHSPESANALKLAPSLPGVFYWSKVPTGGFALKVAARDGDQQHYCFDWKQPWYINSKTGQCGQVEMEIPGQMLTALLSMRPVSEQEARGLPILLADLGLADFIPAPPIANAVQVRTIPSPPQLTVELLAPPGANRGERAPTAILSFNHTQDRVTADALGRITLERADKQAESSAVQRLLSLGLEEITAQFAGKQSDTRYFRFGRSEQWLDFGLQPMEQLRGEGWQISAKAEMAMCPLELSDEDLNFEISDDSSWWFSLALNIDIGAGKKVPLLPVLVSAVRQLPKSDRIADAIEQLNHGGKFYAHLDDGKLISLPFERIRSIVVSLQEILQRTDRGDKIQASVMHVRDLLADATLFKSRWLGAERVLDLAERLKRLACQIEVGMPASFRAELRPYQLEGVKWLQNLAREQFAGILADDMGLGKTIQLLAHICLEKANGRLNKPFLVVCPTSVLPNWLSEAEKFAPELKVIPFCGANRAAQVEKFDTSDLVVTTYPILTRATAELQERQWHAVALDEAQAIKNANTQVARAVRGLRATHRFCLTGTPVENHLGELWSLFQFLLPGLLGDQSTFNSCLRYPIEKEGDLTRKAALAARIRPFLLRRTKQEVATELPEKTIIVQQVELEGAQRDLYETARLAACKKVREEIAKKGFKHSQIMILDALLKLRQVCCDPRLVKMTAANKVKNSAKLEMLMDMLVQLIEDGRKILVFSQFTSMLDLVAPELNAKNIPFVQLRGDTQDRVTPVRQFQNGDYPVFLISLKAGGTGLNLTAADVVIHYDPWWNPAVEEQATDRAHRIGQTKQVFVYRLIARGTIEQRMVNLQTRKRSLADSIYDERGNLNASLTEADLAALLSPIDDY